MSCYEKIFHLSASKLLKCIGGLTGKYSDIQDSNLCSSYELELNGTVHVRNFINLILILRSCPCRVKRKCN